MRIDPHFDPRTCLRTARRAATSVLLTGAGALILLGLTAQTAWAHYPIVSAATPACVNGTIVINFTITSWDVGSVLGSTTPPSGGANGPGDGENPNVEVFFDGAQVASGAFSDPSDSFSGTANAPLGVTSVHVSAIAAGIWGDGYPAGQSSDAWGTSMDVDLSSVTPCAPPPGNGRFTGGGKVVVSNAIIPASGSVTVTKGFEVECDMDPAHENLELNWDVGNHFHMDQITSAVCTLQGIPPNPPPAPVNRIDATGTGSYNGMPGYTVVFTLWDQGEPGTNDEAGFVVCQTVPADPTSCASSPSIVLSVPLQLVSTGNIQAHVDSGH